MKIYDQLMLTRAMFKTACYGEFKDHILITGVMLGAADAYCEIYIIESKIKEIIQCLKEYVKLKEMK